MANRSAPAVTGVAVARQAPLSTCREGRHPASRLSSQWPPEEASEATGALQRGSRTLSRLRRGRRPDVFTAVLRSPVPTARLEPARKSGSLQDPLGRLRVTPNPQTDLKGQYKNNHTPTPISLTHTPSHPHGEPQSRHPTDEKGQRAGTAGYWCWQRPPPPEAPGPAASSGEAGTPRPS